jgi:ubiquinone/menaquinone biosynthesis C-methylase UbiE
MDIETIKTAVRTRYGTIAQEQKSCCQGSSGSPCCGSPASSSAAEASRKLGYTAEDIAILPEGANLGLGCGNPQVIAQLKKGEIVLDLGSGGGIDCFLASRAVGPEGRVIGVDMTPDMVALARSNAAKSGLSNVEFRLGEIEHLPVADDSVDVVISNCVINLSPEKRRVFLEAFRVLKSGGRLAVSDMVASGPIPEELKSDLSLYSSCVAGASTVEELTGFLREAGFIDIRISPKEESKSFVKEWVPEIGVEDYALSASIEARKP